MLINTGDSTWQYSVISPQIESRRVYADQSNNWIKVDGSSIFLKVPLVLLGFEGIDDFHFAFIDDWKETQDTVTSGEYRF